MSKGSDEEKGDMLKSLTAEQMQELELVFTRADKDHAGIVTMGAYLEMLAKMIPTDQNNVLERALKYFKKSLSRERYEGYRTFHTVIELLLPRESKQEIEHLMDKMERAKAKKLNANTMRSRLQKVGKMAALAARTAGAFGGDEDDGEVVVDPANLKEISLQKRMELQEIFNYFAPDGKLKRDVFYFMVADIMKHDERINFFNYFAPDGKLKRDVFYFMV